MISDTAEKHFKRLQENLEKLKYPGDVRTHMEIELITALYAVRDAIVRLDHTIMGKD